MEQIRNHRTGKAVRRAKNALLLCLCMVTLVVPIFSGSGGTAFSAPVTAQAAGYDDVALEMAGATAFSDARNAAVKGDTGSSEGGGDEAAEDAYDNFLKNIGILCGNSPNGNQTSWGNVGILIGPRSHGNSDDWSTAHSPISVNQDQIEQYDHQTNSAFSKYKAFGGAVQKLNEKAKKGSGSAYSVQKGLDQITSAGASLANLGVNLVQKYNPAPLVLAMVDSSELDRHPDNALVAVVNGNQNMREVFNVLGGRIAFGLPTTFVIMAFIVFILLITSVLMTLFNGRSAGENVRKAMVKVFIGCVSVPLIGLALTRGIDFLGEVTATSVTTTQDNYVRQNLNLLDWYACGFAMPADTSIVINEDGEFVMTPDAVEKINKFSYQQVTGETPTSTNMMERMEETYNLSEAGETVVAFSEPIRDSDGKPWATGNYYQIMANFGSNTTPLNDGCAGYNPEGRNGDLANVGYLSYASLAMSKSGNTWNVNGTGTPYGISPIAATNLMRTDFAGSSITANTSGTIGGVVFNADTGATADTQMNPLVRFMAMWAIIMAGIKGLVTIFVSGFGGLIGGSAKSAMGMSTGLGQALGGVVALVGGIFGISLIMTLSFTLIDQIYGVLCEVIDSLLASFASDPNSLLDDICGLVSPIPIIGSILERMFLGLASLILSVLAAFILPKFGGVPVTMFCQYLAEIPHRFAAEAQQIENKVTGDFRAGGAGFGSGGMSASTLINQASSQAGNNLRQMGQGVATMAGAVAGFGMTKLGKHIESKHSGSSDKSMSSSDTETVTEGNGLDEAQEAEETAAAFDAEAREAAEAAEGMPEAGDTTVDGDETGVSGEEAGTPEESPDAEGSTVVSNTGDTVSQDGDKTEGDSISGKEETREVSEDSDSASMYQADSDTDSTSDEATNVEDSLDSEVREDSSMAQEQDSDTQNMQDTQTSDTKESENEALAEQQAVAEKEQQELSMVQQDSEADSTSSESTDATGQTVNEQNTETMADSEHNGEQIQQSDNRQSSEHSSEQQNQSNRNQSERAYGEHSSSKEASSMAQTGYEHSGERIHQGEHTQMNQSDASVHTHASVRSGTGRAGRDIAAGTLVGGALHQAAQKNGVTPHSGGQRTTMNGKTPQAQRAGRPGVVASGQKAPQGGTGTRQAGSMNRTGQPGQRMTQQTGGRTAQSGSMNRAGQSGQRATQTGQRTTQAGQRTAQQTGQRTMQSGSMNPNGQRMAARTPGVVPPTQRGSQAPTPSKGDAVRSQKRDRFMRALGQGLQAAGGHTDASAMMTGIAAGAVHTAGSAMGAGNVTQRAVNLNREATARRRDMARGVDPSDRRRRQPSQNPAGGRTPQQNHAANDRRTVNQANYERQVMEEEVVRQTEAEDAARRNPR